MHSSSMYGAHTNLILSAKILDEFEEEKKLLARFFLCVIFVIYNIRIVQ
jgi:hypothetical protein